MKKGFTLVELLAVVVILGIIVLIAVPVVLSVIDNAKKGAFESDAKLVMDAINKEMALNADFNPETIDKDTIVSTLGLSNDNYEDVEVTQVDGTSHVVIVGKNKWNGLTAYGTFDDMMVVNSDDYDITAPTVSFSPNGNSTYTKSRNIIATVNDPHLSTGSLKYQWTTSTSAPAESSFSTQFTNGGTINSPAGVTGSYYLWILAKDTSNNEIITKSNVFNFDNAVPVITLNGSSTVTINAGSTYTDQGATASDNIDGDITSNVLRSGSVNSNSAGTYTLTYNVSDSAGNAATAVTRTVNVADTTAPVVAFSLNGNSTYAKTRSSTVTITDDVGVNASSLKYQWTTSTSSPTEASFSTAFTNGGTINSPAGVTGNYYLWILAKDTSNNTVIFSSNVFKLDNTVPVITIIGSSPISIVQGGTYTDQGATASDNIDGTITSNIIKTSSINTSVIGTYTVTYNVSDSSGNVAVTVTRIVNVIAGVYSYTYTGGSQTLTVPATGTYKLEVWGAKGGGSAGGNGGYATGQLTLTSGQVLYIYVGGQGATSITGGYNGGGTGANGYFAAAAGSGGGGSTDIRTNSSDLNTRLIVAAGGGGQGGTGDGGGAGSASAAGGSGGAGSQAGSDGTSAGYGGGGGAASSTSGGTAGRAGSTSSSSTDGTYRSGSGGGGGGGYYGGGGGGSGAASGNNTGSSGYYGSSGSFGSGGAGGAGCYNSTGYYAGSGGGGGGGSSYTGSLTNSTIIAGNASMPAPAGGTETGHAGSGYTKITFIGS